MSLYIKGVTNPLGYQQITSLGAAAGLNVPSDPSKPPATVAVIIPEGQTVRWRDDGVSPTALVGMPLLANDALVYEGDLASIKFIQTVSGAALNVSYYATSTPTPTPTPSQLTPPAVVGTTAQTGHLTVTSGTYTGGTVVTTLIRGGSTETTPYAKSADDALVTFWARDTVTSGGIDYVFNSLPLTVVSSATPTPPPDVITTDFATATAGQTLVDLGYSFTDLGYAAAANTYTVHSDGLLYLDATDAGDHGSSQTSMFSRDGTTNNVEFRCTMRNPGADDTQTTQRKLFASVSSDKATYFYMYVTGISGNVKMGYRAGGSEIEFYFANPAFPDGISDGDTFSIYIDRAAQTVYQMFNGAVVPIVSAHPPFVITADGGIDISGIAVPATATVALTDFGNTWWAPKPPYPVSEQLQILSYEPSTDINIINTSYNSSTDEIVYTLANVVTQAQMAILDVTTPDYPVLVSSYTNIPDTGTLPATDAGSFVYLFRDTANPGAVVESDQINVFGLRASKVGMNAGTYSGIEYWNQQVSCYADRMNQAEWAGDNNRRLYQNGPNPNACFDNGNRLISWPDDMTFIRLNIGWCIHPSDEGDYEWLTGGVYTLANYDEGGASGTWRLENTGGASVSVDLDVPGPNGGPVFSLGPLNGESWFIRLTGSLPAPMTKNTFRKIGELDPAANMTQGWVDSKILYGNVGGDTRWMQWPPEGFQNWGGVLQPSDPDIQWITEKGYTPAQWLANFPNWEDRYTAGKFLPEYAIETASRSGSPYYANLPWVVTDDYLHGYFALIRDTLDSGIDRVPVELENEVWNTAVPDFAWFFLQGYRAGYNGDTASRTSRTVIAQDAVASVFTASIAVTGVMTVTGSPAGMIYPGQYVDVAGLTPGSVIKSQLTGTPGGAGTYELTAGATIASTTVNTWNPSNERVSGVYSTGELLFRTLYGTTYKTCIFEAKRTTTHMDLPYTTTACDFVGGISGSTLTITAVNSGSIAIGPDQYRIMLPDGSLVGVTITGFDGGSGDTGTYYVNNPNGVSVSPGTHLLAGNGAASVGCENDDWLCVASSWETTSVFGKEALGNGFIGTWRYWAVEAQRIMNIAKQYIEPGRLVAVLGGFTEWTVGNQLTMNPATDPVYAAFTFPVIDGGEGLIDVMDGYVEFNDAPYLPNINVCSMTADIATLAPGSARQAGMATVFENAWNDQKAANFAKIWGKRPYLADLAAAPRTVNGKQKRYSPARVGKGYYEGGQQFRSIDVTADFTGGTGGVSSTTLTVSAVNGGQLAAYDNNGDTVLEFAPGQYVFTVDGSGSKTPLNVYITAHPSGSVGGTGTYTLSGAVTLANGTHLAAGNDDQFISDGNGTLRSAAIEASLTEFLEYCWQYGGSGCLFDEGTPSFDHQYQQYAWTWFDAIPDNYLTPTPGTPAALVAFLNGL